jgi:hypothetical protein
MVHLKSEYRPGDVVLVEGPRRVNTVRYCAKRAGLERIDVRGPFAGFGKGHYVHVASVTADDLVHAENELHEYRRIWTVFVGPNGVEPPNGTKRVWTQLFTSGANYRCRLSLYERDRNGPESGA